MYGVSAVLADPSVESLPWMPYIAIGSGDAADSELSDALETELYRKLGTVFVKSNTYFITATFGQGEPDTDDLEIKEIGIFSAASNGTMGARWVLATAVDKDNIDVIVIECAVTILHGE